MITPRRTRLLRVPDLTDFRRTICALCSGTSLGAADARAVVVPTRAAAAQLGRTMVDLNGTKAPDGPLLLTRDQLYDELHARLASPPRRLTPLERDTIAQAAAHAVARVGAPLPFQIRPGLVAEMVRFYDQLRRQSQRVERFEELIFEALGGPDREDRGVERLLAQTRFLAGAFRAYERRILECGACDEHLLRERLIDEAARSPLRHVIVTVPDWIADPAGLFLADFDLLTRLPGLEALDIVCPESVLRSGFHERVHSWLPGIEEDTTGTSRRLPFGPRLVCPTPGPASADLWFTYRDREEELIAIARRLKSEGHTPADLGRTAVVFKRPLPYLYLAPDTFGAAGIAYEVSDALPLAAEPTVAAVDVILDAVETRFSRNALIALLRSPHLRFADEGVPVTPEAIGALDRTLSNLRYLGDIARLESLASSWLEEGTCEAAEPALRAALAAARGLVGFLEPAPAAGHIERLAAFIEGHFRPLDNASPFAAREHRARVTIMQLLRDLSAAHLAHHNPTWTIDDLVAAVRRWVGEETFLVETGSRGVRLVDDQAARYGEYDDITIVGLVESEWPEQPRRNVFYPSGLLKALGWPSEKDRRAAADARFVDLHTSAAQTVVLSTFTLDDDAPATRSLQLDDVARAGLSTVTFEAGHELPAFPDEALLHEPPQLECVGQEARPWAEMRACRSSADHPEFHGRVGSQASRSWSVSALETYLACPFKFFAQHALRLEEEPEDEEVMDPRRRGRLVHEVFEEFFRSWQAAGNGQISAANLEAARRMLVEVVDRSLARLPESEAGLERTRLLGSSAAAGLGEAVFRMEAERPVPVVERLLEHPLRGRFVMSTVSGPRVVELRGKADRLDLLADGTFRLIDYKLGWPPDKSRALQLPIYGLCAEQRLAEDRSRRWTLGEAVYIAFGGPRRVVPLFTSTASRDEVLGSAQQRLVDTLDAIERGEFPPSPDDVYRCDTCSFASVCRKDYVGDV